MLGPFDIRGPSLATTSQGTAAQAGRRFAEAHDALVRDGSIQFTLRPPDPPPQPPAWLKDLGEWISWALSPIGRLFAWLASFIPDAPYARVVFWIVIVAAGCLLAWLVADRIRHGRWWRRRRRVAVEAGEEPEWTPDAAPARAWLREADALAAQGRYAEAIHHLLLRSVEDIARRRPRLVRPALTSRDIARADGIPGRARTIFGDLAGVVERSLFGARPVAADDWTRARAAYADFALAEAWA